MFCGVTSAAPLVDADAPLASDSDNPAAPKTGTVLRLLFFTLRHGTMLPIRLGIIEPIAMIVRAAPTSRLCAKLKHRFSAFPMTRCERARTHVQALHVARRDRR